MDKIVHHGRNLKRFREMLGVKQESLAISLGEDWNQRKVSILEQKDTIDEEILVRVSAILRIPVEAFKNFDEQQAVNIISNTFSDDASAYVENYKCVFNPLEKWLETLEKNEKLYKELLQEKDEQIKLLKSMVDPETNVYKYTGFAKKPNPDEYNDGGK